MSDDLFMRLPRRSRRARIEDTVVDAVGAALYATTSPIGLWFGHVILGYAVPGWAYAAVWLLSVDVAMFGAKR